VTRLSFPHFRACKTRAGVRLRRCSDCSFTALPASLTTGFPHCCHSTWLGATAAHAATLARPVTPRQPTGWKRLRRFAGLASSLGHRHRCSEYLQGDPGCPTGRLPAEAGHSNYRRVAPRLAHETSGTSCRGLRRMAAYLFSARLAQGQPGVCSCTHSFLGVVRAKFEKLPLSNAPPLPSLSVPRRRTPLRRCAGGEKEARRIMRCATAPPACRCASASLAGPHHFARHSRANTTLYLKPSSKSSSEPA
jgi:hypothetical protein